MINLELGIKFNVECGIRCVVVFRVECDKGLVMGCNLFLGIFVWLLFNLEVLN